MRFRCLIAVAMAFAPGVAVAQSAAPQIEVGYEWSADDFHYFFENPSTFDSGELIPHNFKQTYGADSHWLIVSARYRLAGYRWRTSFAITPSREVSADDVDTFFLRTGDMATSGTSGRAEMRSLRILQELTAPAGRWQWHSGYQYRRDRSEFHARQIKTVTHTEPPSSTSFPIDGAETTISEVHEVRIGISSDWDAGNGWRLEARIDTSPATYARLTTYLPIKYPGRAIVFSAPVLTINPSVTIARGAEWPVRLSLSGLRTFSYVQSRQFHRQMWAIAVDVGKVF